jgi:uroporphyrinogen decarboxylase
MNNLTPKQRTLRVLTYLPVDRLPTQINYTSAMGVKLASKLGVPLEQLPDRLDNHLIRVDISYERKYCEDRHVNYDWWGVGWDTQEEGYFTSLNPLAEDKDLDAFNWPDPDEATLLDLAAETITADQDVHFIVPNFGFALFERAWTLRGFDNFLMDLALDHVYAAELLERITNIQLVLIKRYLALGVDGGYFGDDYGAQKNMLFSPRLWRQLIKPRLARLFAPFLEAGLPVLMHSDGQIAEILPDLIEIGLSVYNPVQPEVVDHSWLRDTFGVKLAYYGGISTQTVLPHGNPSEVRQSVVDCISTLAPTGTGLLIAPSHRMMLDIPLDNVLAMLDAFQRTPSSPE